MMMNVIKVGGSIFSRADSLLDDLSGLNEPFVLVHGGAAESTALAEKLGIPPKFITSPSGFRSRYTDLEQVEVFKMVVAGRINKTLVAQLQKRGVNAIGLSGVDGNLLLAKRKVTRSQEEGKIKIIRDDYTGKISRVNSSLLSYLVEAGYSPLIAPISLSEECEVLNCDGDRAASMIARALHSERLILFTDVDGYFRDFPEDFAPELRLSELDECIENAKSGMKRKLLSAKEALENGVGEVVIANGSIGSPVSNALGGKRTLIKRD
jgi:[amino group carrier protein]-L-2-aminoadipate 6-kinase